MRSVLTTKLTCWNSYVNKKPVVGTLDSKFKWKSKKIQTRDFILSEEQMVTTGFIKSLY